MEDVVEIIDEDSALFFKLMNFNLGEENQHKSPILSKAGMINVWILILQKLKNTLYLWSIYVQQPANKETLVQIVQIIKPQTT